MKLNFGRLTNEIRGFVKKLTHIRATRRQHKMVEDAHESNESDGNRNHERSTDTCTICFAETYVDQMFIIPSCQHSYCLACMSGHAEAKILNGFLPKCPQEDCRAMLQPDICKEFLRPELVNIMSQRIRETSTPAEDRIYCPNPRCSVLFSRTELQESHRNRTSARKCPNCKLSFCFECKVPWHGKMTCTEYKRKNPYTSPEERELHCLATREKWRQCPKCSIMVSINGGCNHIFCRCGHHFCYKCGAKWISNRATCRCPVWEQEYNIVYRGRDARLQGAGPMLLGGNI